MRNSPYLTEFHLIYFLPLLGYEISQYKKIITLIPEGISLHLTCKHESPDEFLLSHEDYVEHKIVGRKIIYTFSVKEEHHNDFFSMMNRCKAPVSEKYQKLVASKQREIREMWREFDDDGYDIEIPWKEDWEVKEINPNPLARRRLLVSRGDKQVSVYLDIDDSLGCMQQPYWEAYTSGMPDRCLYADVEQLVNMVEKQLDEADKG